jgi:tRNA threonylcarbamoyl adenosine modification protein YjeE
MTPDLVSLPDLSATEAAATRLARFLRRGDLVALQGPLGAGKTTFTRALLRAFGVKDDVPSPTFTLLQSYDTREFPVHHFDLYRLNRESDLEELGWDEALADGLVLVEWPERAQRRLPANLLMLHFALDARGARSLAIEPRGAWIERMKNEP